MSGNRISRRVFIGGALAAGGAAAAGLTAFRLAHEGGSPPRTPLTATPGTGPGTPTATPPPKGGIARIAAFERFNFDTFDALRTGEPSVLEVLGRTHSRLVDWVRFDEPTLGAGLADRWEQPDGTTVVLHIDPRARWQGVVGPMPSRVVTADDIVQHFKRRLGSIDARLPLVQRPADYASWEKVEAIGADTVRITTRGADPFVLQTLAGRFALVQSPESVAAFGDHWEDLRPETVAGSGAFRFDRRQEDGPLVFAAARGGHREPNLDGLEVHEPGGYEDLLALKRDEYLSRDRRDTAVLRGETRLSESSRYEDSPVISTFFIGAPPWNNPDLLRALSAALSRKWLGEALFDGRAEACGPVSRASGVFALDEASLARFPGYGPDPDAEAVTAAAIWKAAGGPGLGTVTIDFPNIFDPRYSASSAVVGRLSQLLGPHFKAAVEPYTTISAKTADGRYGNGHAAFWFGWGPPLVEPDPARQLIEMYSASGPNATLLGFKRDSVDDRLRGVLATMPSSSPQRAALQDAQRAILEAGGRGVITWLLQRAELFRWRYWNGSPATPFWNQHLDSGNFLDPAVEPFSARRGP